MSNFATKKIKDRNSSMKFRILFWGIVVCLSIICLNKSYGEVQLTVVSTTMPKNVFVETPYTFEVVVVNSGTIDYSGNIDLNHALWLGGQAFPLSEEFEIEDKEYSLPKGDSIHLLVKDYRLHLSQSEAPDGGYMKGGNVIIVWPKVLLEKRGLDFYYKLNIDSAPSAIFKNSSENDIKISCNSNNTELIISIADDNFIESLKIYDYTGKMVYFSSFQKFINIQNYEPGLYIIELRNRKGILVRRFHKR